jgi:hypothetical protein
MNRVEANNPELPENSETTAKYESVRNRGDKNAKQRAPFETIGKAIVTLPSAEITKRKHERRAQHGETNRGPRSLTLTADR